jgi:hypothetical protein
METCPFKERTQPWSQPWVKRDLQYKNLSHFPLSQLISTLQWEKAVENAAGKCFTTAFKRKILKFRADKVWQMHAGSSPLCVIIVSGARSDSYFMDDALPPSLAVVEADCHSTQNQSMAHPHETTMILHRLYLL